MEYNYFLTFERLVTGFASSGSAPICSNKFIWLSPLVKGLGMKGVASGLNGSGEVKIGGVKTCELTPLSVSWLFSIKIFI